MNYKYSNVIKGTAGEQAIRSALNELGYKVKPHNTTDSGLDIEAIFNNHKSVCCEVINWYGGYIHPNRFKKLVWNLITGKYNEKILICFGVEPTLEQKRLLRGYNIKLLCLPRIENISIRGVIHLLSNIVKVYSREVVNRSYKYPIYVEWSSSVEKEVRDWTFTVTFWLKVRGDSV